MKTIELDTKSLHYRLATEYGGLESYTISTDTCSYPWYVFKGFLATILIAIVGAVLASILLAPIFHLLMELMYGFIFETPKFVLVGDAFWGVITGVVAIGFYKEKIQPIQEAKRKGVASKHGSLYYMYHSWKDKVCYKIVFKDKGEWYDKVPHMLWILLDNGKMFRVEIPIGEKIPYRIRDNATYIYDETVDTGSTMPWHTHDAEFFTMPDKMSKSEIIPWIRLDEVNVV